MKPTAPSAREVALSVLMRVEKGGKAGRSLDAEMEKHRLATRERRLATEITYGTLRWRNTIDWALDGLLGKRLNDLTIPIRNLLRIGTYQILYLDGVPAHAAVFETVEMAKKYGHPGSARLVNAVLRNLNRRKDRLTLPDPSMDPVKATAIRLSHPEWLVKRWYERFGPTEADALMKANLEVPPLVVRANTLKGGAGAFREMLRAEKVASRPGRYLPQAFILEDCPPLRTLGCFRQGLFSVQDESSMLASLVCDPRPSETVIDACAAPGGKTAHLAELMGDQGRVIAVEVNPGRIPVIRDNLKRLGLGCVETIQGDARQLDRLYPGKADRILVDAPCSGLGVLRRNPDSKWNKTESDIGVMAGLQREILEGVWCSLKPGGVLVYSVCTLEPEETDGVVEAFLEEHPESHLDDLDSYLPETLRGQGEQGRLRLYPHRHGIDGFFIARMRRGEGQA